MRAVILWMNSYANALIIAWVLRSLVDTISNCTVGGSRPPEAFPGIEYLAWSSSTLFFLFLFLSQCLFISHSLSPLLWSYQVNRPLSYKLPVHDILSHLWFKEMEAADHGLTFGSKTMNQSKYFFFSRGICLKNCLSHVFCHYWEKLTNAHQSLNCSQTTCYRSSITHITILAVSW